MTTAAKGNEELTSRAALDAANTVVAAAAAAMTAARQEITDTEKRLADLEAAVAAGDFQTKAALTAARSDIETARSDAEWAVMALAASEAAYSRATDDAAAAQRRVTAEEYLAAHLAHNDENTHVNVLLASLTDTITELVPLVSARDELHCRMTQAWDYLSPTERPAVPRGVPITHTPPPSPSTMISVPFNAIASAIEAGIAAAQR